MYNFDYIAHFIISDNSNDISKYSHLLIGLPFEQIKKGEERYNKSGGKLNRKASLSYLKWRLHVEDEASSEQKPLDEVVFKCIRQIDNQKPLFRELHGLGADVAIELALRPDNSYAVLTLSPKLTEKLSENGIQLHLCFIVPPATLKGS
ncbi:MAG TPA: hypothetical protein VH280_15175 [Verrucomicrobiae bacterium]|jgi:hypothetical protein|nr:hypothetical protein [Verrucomicrobiae bacterium]